MKRIIFGILVLVIGWQLVQVSSVNSALFAFLTLGINPLTNHTLSTPYLIAVLFAIGLAGILLFFNRALSDFFGGLFDWLTRAEHSYIQSVEEAVTPKLSFDPAPVKAATQITPKSQALQSLPSFLSFAASVRAVELPKVTLPDFRPQLKTLSRRYNQFLDDLRSKLRTPEEPIHKSERVSEEADLYSEALAPEMAEVLAIFENLALESALAEPFEAEVVEPTIPKEPNAFLIALQDAIEKVEWMLGITKQRAHSKVLHASKRANQLGTVTSSKAQSAANVTVMALVLTSKKTVRVVYHGALLAALWVLLAADKITHLLAVSARFVNKAAQLAYRKTMRGTMLAAVGITLGMFAVGRGIVSGVKAFGRGLAKACRGVYWLLSMGVMLAFLGAGYTLFVFSLVAFMAWELFEPYARKLDKWLGDSLGDDEGMTEIAKVGHEMSRTAAQWYRELRNIKHGIYR